MLLKITKNIFSHKRHLSLFKYQYNSSNNQQPKTTAISKAKSFSQYEAIQMIEQQNQLRKTILQQIQHLGELKMQQYWKIALTDSQYGYYQNKNVFSSQGDFTTSPQISPLFGEMIGVWIAYFLNKRMQERGDQKMRFRIVQLGPGRGLLMKDIVKTLKDTGYTKNFDITFIQVSEFNRKEQQQNVIEQFQKQDQFFKFEYESQNKQVQAFTSENLDSNINLMWVASIEKLMEIDLNNTKQGNQPPLTVFVCNQFFDALPTTALQYTQQGWRERVLKKSNKQNLFLELGISNNKLPQKLTPTLPNPKVGDVFEVSPQSLLTVDVIAKMVLKYGGCLLNVDYGAQGYFSDSIRAIKDHKYVPNPYFWQVPGACDLSAYVNFASLAQFACQNRGIKAYEAIPQGFFLEAMGINPRIDILSKKMNKQGVKRILSEYDRLVLPSQMGQIYKVQLITKAEYGQIYPWIQNKQNEY